jgi:hypothetical protein
MVYTVRGLELRQLKVDKRTGNTVTKLIPELYFMILITIQRFAAHIHSNLSRELTVHN